ncbi:e3 ubiquitin-protein ligase sinat2-like [Cystoisospora suis]|uniref:RING-type E3 ubiquitin transferase n=1 Tax=Cystoisospora suis TaxID=483139 RepID=A0A2C6LGW1_9APIC|nr:e3 ubiquitin-protein ligase sinat2-like [Cystoisospora suis]
MNRRGVCGRWEQDGPKVGVGGAVEGGHEEVLSAFHALRVTSSGADDRCVERIVEGQGELVSGSHDSVSSSVPVDRSATGAESIMFGSQAAPVLYSRIHTARVDGSPAAMVREGLQGPVHTEARISPRDTEQVAAENALLSQNLFLGDECARNPTSALATALADATAVFFQSSINGCDTSSSHPCCVENGPLQFTKPGACVASRGTDATGGAPTQSLRDKTDQPARRARKIRECRPSEDVGGGKQSLSTGDGGAVPLKGLGTQTTATLELLECGVCCEAMQSPIFQCVEGHTLCRSCKARVQQCPVCRSPDLDIRCRALERLADRLVDLPCRYRSFGCKDLLAYTQRQAHEQQCLYRPMQCPEARERALSVWILKRPSGPFASSVTAEFTNCTLSTDSCGFLDGEQEPLVKIGGAACQFEGSGEGLVRHLVRVHGYRVIESSHIRTRCTCQNSRTGLARRSKQVLEDLAQQEKRMRPRKKNSENKKDTLRRTVEGFAGGSAGLRSCGGEEEVAASTSCTGRRNQERSPSSGTGGRGSEGYDSAPEGESSGSVERGEADGVTEEQAGSATNGSSDSGGSGGMSEGCASARRSGRSTDLPASCEESRPQCLWQRDIYHCYGKYFVLRMHRRPEPEPQYYISLCVLHAKHHSNKYILRVSGNHRTYSFEGPVWTAGRGAAEIERVKDCLILPENIALFLSGAKGSENDLSLMDLTIVGDILPPE